MPKFSDGVPAKLSHKPTVWQTPDGKFICLRVPQGMESPEASDELGYLSEADNLHTLFASARNFCPATGRGMERESEQSFMGWSGVRKNARYNKRHRGPGPMSDYVPHPKAHWNDSMSHKGELSKVGRMAFAMCLPLLPPEVEERLSAMHAAIEESPARAMGGYPACQVTHNFRSSQHVDIDMAPSLMICTQLRACNSGGRFIFGPYSLAVPCNHGDVLVFEPSHLHSMEADAAFRPAEAGSPDAAYDRVRCLASYFCSAATMSSIGEYVETKAK